MFTGKEGTGMGLWSIIMGMQGLEVEVNLVIGGQGMWLRVV